MPIIVAAFIGAFVSALSTIVGRVLISLGLGFVTYQGFTVLMDFIKERVFSQFLGLDPLALQVISTLQIDAAINIFFSAITIRLLIAGVTGGTFTRAVWKA